MERKLESKFNIGDPVYIEVKQGTTTHLIEGFIRTIFFTTSKVRYSVYVSIEYDDKKYLSTFHNIDSVFIKERFGEKIELEADNYS